MLRQLYRKVLPNRKILSLLPVIGTAIILSSCNTSVTVGGSIPTPLVRQIPLHVGIYFSPELTGYTHEEVLPGQGTWRISMGQQNKLFFSKMFTALFLEVTEVAEFDLPVDEEDEGNRVTLPEGMDALIVPEILKYGFLTPQISGLDFFSASIHYRVRIYGKDGDLALDWVIVGYGKSPDQAFSAGDALENATTLAIRDAGARIAIEAPRHPAVLKWLQSNNVTLN
jgi:hypothetical protein